MQFEVGDLVVSRYQQGVAGKNLCGGSIIAGQTGIIVGCHPNLPNLRVFKVKWFANTAWGLWREREDHLLPMPVIEEVQGEIKDFSEG